MITKFHNSRIYQVLIAVILIIGIAALIPVLVKTATVNRASLVYFKQVWEASLDNQTMPEPPVVHPRMVVWEALAAFRSGDYSTAIRLLEPLATTRDQLTLQILGNSYENLGDYSGAIPIWYQMQNTEALLRIGRAAEEAGQLDTAQQAFHALWEIDLENGTEPLASFYERRGYYSAAEAVLRKALEITPTNTYRPYWAFKLAGVLEKQYSWEEAVLAYKQGIAESHLMYPGEQKLPLRYTNLAWAYFMSGQKQHTIESLQTAIQALSADPSREVEVLSKAAQIYEGLGQPARAIDIYRRILELNPNNKAALEGLQRLGAP